MIVCDLLAGDIGLFCEATMSLCRDENSASSSGQDLNYKKTFKCPPKLVINTRQHA